METAKQHRPTKTKTPDFPRLCVRDKQQPQTDKQVPVPQSALILGSGATWPLGRIAARLSHAERLH